MAEGNSNTIALVTGASRGLGRAVAEALGAGGAHVIAVARTVGGLEELDDAIRAKGGAATLAPFDLTDDDGVARLAAAARERWGRIDLWVHTAIHAVALSPADHIDRKDFDRAMAVNATVVHRAIVALAPLLRAAPKGRAVFFDDPDAAGKFHGAYAASKAAARALTTAWAAESRTMGPQVIHAKAPPMPTALRARFHPGEDRSRLTPPAVAADRLVAALAAGKGPELDLRA